MREREREDSNLDYLRLIRSPKPSDQIRNDRIRSNGSKEEKTMMRVEGNSK